MDCVLLKDTNQVFVTTLGPEINFRAIAKTTSRYHPALNPIFNTLPIDP